MFLSAVLRKVARSYANQIQSQDSARPMFEDLEPRRLMSTAVDADFNNDGNQDLLFRNYTTGDNQIWFRNSSGVVTDKVAIPAAPDTEWQIGGSADINRDGTPDIIWHNANTSKLFNAAWILNVTGTTVTRTAVLNFIPTANPNWQLAGVNDFSGDNHPDLLWRNVGDPNTDVSAGSVAYWELGTAPGDPNGPFTTRTNVVSLRNADLSLVLAGNPAYVIKGTGDFNNDNKTDIVFRRITDGTNAIWYVGTAGVVSGVEVIRAATNTAQQLGTVLDWDHDGDPDFVWRNGSTGANSVWIMNDTTVTSTFGFDTLVDTNWQITGGQVL